MQPDIGRLLTAMVTPFAPDGSVNYDAAGRLAVALLESGSEGLIVAGTTGEAPTLTHDEKLRLFAEVKAAIGDRGTVIANTGTNSTAESVELTREARDAGADGVIAVVPYYNKPTQDGMVRHFAAIAEATPLPVILYNVPARTGINMTAETAIELSRTANVAGTKEASGDFDQIGRIVDGAAPGFRVWSGSDEDTLPILSIGGYGAIAVVTHLAGRQVRKMIDAAVGGRAEEAAAIHRKLLPLIDALFLAGNPVPVKYALSQLGVPVGEPRLPLCAPDGALGERIMAEVRRHEIDVPVAV
jgi:4-hydroxy-tetrahydrodipicolinate synthase